MSEATEAVDPRYPIGKFTAPQTITPEHRHEAIQTIAELPKHLHAAVSGLSAEQLNTPYREGGWTVLQLVHHIGDSHSTALHRIKRALTEEWPEVHGYKEKAFAALADTTLPAEKSLGILDGVHAHWVALLASLEDAQWGRGVRHSENGPMTLDFAAQLYAWHCRHHLAHITTLRKQKGW